MVSSSAAGAAAEALAWLWRELAIDWDAAAACSASAPWEAPCTWACTREGVRSLSSSSVKKLSSSRDVPTSATSGRDTNIGTAAFAVRVLPRQSATHCLALATLLATVSATAAAAVPSSTFASLASRQFAIHADAAMTRSALASSSTRFIPSSVAWAATALSSSAMAKAAVLARQFSIHSCADSCREASAAAASASCCRTKASCLSNAIIFSVLSSSVDVPTEKIE